MKSAYELAMSRLEKTAPSIERTADQKKMLAEINSEFEARIAEQRLFIDGEIAKSFSDKGRVTELRRQLAAEIASLEEKREQKKDRIRNGEEK